MSVTGVDDKYGRALSKESRVRCYLGAAELLDANKHITMSAALRDVLCQHGFEDVTDYDLFALFPEYSQTLFRRYVEQIRHAQFLPKAISTHTAECWLNGYGGIYTQLRVWYLRYQAECVQSLLK